IGSLLASFPRRKLPAVRGQSSAASQTGLTCARMCSLSYLHCSVVQRRCQSDSSGYSAGRCPAEGDSLIFRRYLLTGRVSGENRFDWALENLVPLLIEAQGRGKAGVLLEEDKV